LVVQPSPSSQGVSSGLAGLEQVPVAGAQVPAWWHWSLAEQTTGSLPTHAPPLHASERVQAFPSLHAVPSGCARSGGQSLSLPLQLSATSQMPVAGRHTAVLFASAGQNALVPVQNSARSHTPAEARHWVALDWKTFAGQVPAEPVQTSATSQSPAAGRHIVPADLKVQAAVQQEPAVPLLAPSSHCSGAVTMPSPHTATTPTAIELQLHLDEDFGRRRLRCCRCSGCSCPS